MDKQDFLNNFHIMTSIVWSEETGINGISLNNYYILAKIILEYQQGKLGTEVKQIDAKNIYVIFWEKNSDTISIGSHMDSIPNYGKYGGIYNVVSPLQILKEYPSKNGITLIDLANEESSKFKPFILVSCLYTEIFLKDFIYSQKNDRSITFGSVIIAQRSVLEQNEISIGIPKRILTLIVGQYSFTGEYNQAGTTHIGYRNSSFVATLMFISEVRYLAKSVEPDSVIAVVKINNRPNDFNIIPIEVSLNLDARSPYKETAYEYSKKVKEFADTIADEEGIPIKQENLWITDTTILDDDLSHEIAKVCRGLGYKYKFIYRWGVNGAPHMQNSNNNDVSVNERSQAKGKFSGDTILVRGHKLLAGPTDYLMK